MLTQDERDKLWNEKMTLRASHEFMTVENLARVAEIERIEAADERLWEAHAIQSFIFGPYRHWKGGVYYAYNYGYDADTTELEIQYRDICPESKNYGRTWHRTLRDWLAPHDKAPNGVKFKLMDDNDPDRTDTENRFKELVEPARSTGSRPNAVD